MNIDELKSQWQELRLRVDRLEDNNIRLAQQLAAGKAVASKQQLATTYLRGAITGMILPVIAPLLVTLLEFPRWIAVCYALFGLIMSVANLCMRSYILKADYMSLPVIQALENALNIKLRMRRLRFVSMSMGAIVIASIVFELLDKNDTYMSAGFVIGLICGLFIGIIKWRQQSRLSRRMIEELRNADSSTLSDFDED